MDSRSVTIPGKRFSKILATELNAQMIPKTNFFLCLPPHVQGMNDLINTASEFAESSKGSLIENPELSMISMPVRLKG